VTEGSPPTAEESLTTSEAAAQLGISERTLRERIKAGKVRAEKVIDRGNAVYRVYLKGSPPPTDLPPPSTPEDSPPVTKGSPPAAGGLGELVQLLREKD
jgi:excisionase family DNA binding protein